MLWLQVGGVRTELRSQTPCWRLRIVCWFGEASTHIAVQSRNSKKQGLQLLIFVTLILTLSPCNWTYFICGIIYLELPLWSEQFILPSLWSKCYTRFTSSSCLKPIDIVGEQKLPPQNVSLSWLFSKKQQKLWKPSRSYFFVRNIYICKGNLHL